MEHSIDPKTQPEYAVGTDPAYVPGLVSPLPAGAGRTDPEQTEHREPDDAVPQDASPQGRTEEEPASEEGVAGTAEEVEDGPVFEVADRRGSIVADRGGVRFRLDDEEAEFRWDEIAAVEMRQGRFGRRFTVTVHVATKRWFDAEVEAPARSDLKGWEAQLDEVLDAYFEE